MLEALVLLSAQADRRWSTTDPVIVSPSDRQEVQYRDCLAEHAARYRNKPATSRSIWRPSRKSPALNSMKHG